MTEFISTIRLTIHGALYHRARTIHSRQKIGWALFFATFVIACSGKSTLVSDNSDASDSRGSDDLEDAAVVQARNSTDSATDSDSPMLANGGFGPQAGIKSDDPTRASQSSPAISTPQVVGTLVGPDVTYVDSDLRVYGTDMGSTFEHKGKHFVLFGDTWPDDSFICENFAPSNDDTIGTIPLDYPGEVPKVDFFTQSDTPTEASLIHLYRGDESMGLGFGLIPIIGFSDDVNAYAFFTRTENVPCDPSPESTSQLCPVEDAFFCTTEIGICEPGPPFFCNTTLNQGCIIGQSCVASSLCVDSTSSQHVDGDTWSQTAAIAHNIDIAVQDESHPELFNSVFSWPTNKFSVLTARTVKSFTGRIAGNDYGPGYGRLFIWGRPGFIGEDGRSAHLYFATHELPFALEEGRIEFHPQYFAGLDRETGEPTWSERQSDAKSLALDGVVGGDPYEEVPMVGHMTVSWLGPPIEKWVLLYGGDLVDYLLSDPEANRYAASPGSIIIRFADFPWGPWSAPVPHLVPGSPFEVGDCYGPSGILYHPGCSDDGSHPCARPNPHRPLDTVALACILSVPDPGRLYAPNIIDRYTTSNSQGGLDMYWNVSTWNPYTVQLMKTSLFP